MAASSLSESDMATIKKGLAELEKEADAARAREAEVQDEEKHMPWNVDTLSKEGFSKTVVNKPMPRFSFSLSLFHNSNDYYYCCSCSPPAA